ncbi:MAG TPA: c-type cytochrome domain-containing protein [Chryseolinea sp.]|nr:c-type cytochrome domain-containing protein [Chryseolinea sp.]
MFRFFRIASNTIFFIQVLLLFLLFAEDRIALPPLLQVAGRMHPLILHLPIGMLILVGALVLLGKQFDTAHNHKAVHFALLFASLSASIAALFGFFLSLQGDYAGDAMTTHKYAGVTLSWLCYGLVVIYQSQVGRRVFLAVGGVVFALLIAAGHTGAVLTHGENFLLEPLKGPEVKLTAENAPAYDYAIKPILEAKCFTCHNETKAKGKLVMTDRNRFMTGGEHGSPWVAGKPEESRMIKAFYLPLEHDEHMPPDGKAQLTAVEIAALKAWVRSGADFDKKLAEFPENDSLKIMVASLVASKPAPPTEKVYAFTSASETSIEKVNTPFVTVAPLYQGSPALQADFYVRKGFDIKSLEALGAVKDQLVSLSLSKMPVADKDLSLVGKFTNLELLNLNFTNINGSGLSALAPLKSLRSLSLASTGVRAHLLDPVLKLPQLRHLFLWNTGVSDAQRDSLKQKYPAVSIALTQFTDESVMRLNRPMIENEGVFAPGSEISFRHPMTGVSIHYTTDGSRTDSITGRLYDKPFTIDRTTLVKAVACKNGWYCSEPVEQILFVRGVPAKTITLLNEPDPQYPGEGAVSLTDGRKGIADVLKEPSWLGYQKQPFEAVFRFDKGEAPRNEVVVSYGRSIYSHCFPPQSVEVWAGNDEKSMHLIRKMDVEQPSNYVPVKVDRVAIPLDGEEFIFYKLIATPLPKLPAWFSKKGEKGWFFVDEVFFY